MPTDFNRSITRQGVSIITCTNRQTYRSNLLQNFQRQRHGKKELLIIVNGDDIPLQPYLKLAAEDKRIRVYRVPEKRTLGACLNFAVKKTKYDYVAKFDDDDYYAPRYLSDSLQVIAETDADVIGKRAHYMYLRGSKTLLLRFPRDENRSVSQLPGATLIFKKHVFSKVRFPNVSIGEDDQFCLRCKERGFKVYSGDRHHFVAIRRKNSFQHTWIISDETLIAHHQVIPNVKNIRRFVQRKQTDEAST